jgi:putative transposase
VSCILTPLFRPAHSIVGVSHKRNTDMKNDFVSSARSVSDLKAHLVLCTKYRRKVLNNEMLARLNEVFADLSEKWSCKLIEFNGEADYIHLLFQYYPQMDLSKFVNNIKSVASRRLRSEFPERVNEFYRKDVLWSSSYFIASCGGVTVSTLRKYIENQDAPED